MLLYRGKAPGNGHWAKSRSFFIEAQLLATVRGQNLILLYRGTAPGNGHWAKSRPFFIEAQLLAMVIGQNHHPSL